MSSTSAWRSIFSELDSHFVLKNLALLLSGSDDVIATKVHNAVCDFVDAAAKERSLPNSWRGERVDEVVQRFHHRLSGKVDRHARDDREAEGLYIDRHAALAMTYMVDYVTARGLTADVVVQTLTLTSV